MSDVAPPSPQTPGATPPPTSPAGDGTRLSLGAVIGIAIAVLVIAGVGGYLIGHGKGESSGDSKGYADGVAAGQQQVRAEFEPGKPAYQRIFAAGQAAGRKQGQQTGEAQGKQVGFEQGRRQGVTTGQSEGVKQGAAAVLGGFDAWTVGSYYVITMEAGTTDGVAYTIDTRTQLQPGTNYRICEQGGTTQLCESPVADDNGGAQE